MNTDATPSDDLMCFACGPRTGAALGPHSAGGALAPRRGERTGGGPDRRTRRDARRRRAASMTPRVAILSAVRTPIGRFLGSLASQSAADLGVVATRAAL